MIVKVIREYAAGRIRKSDPRMRQENRKRD